ncbi:MAG: hypothetical protein LBH20_02770, partial [Treponema sp.]|nr:hypothetical protein [Treponema sp.]
PPERMSLWRELRVTLALMTIILLESLKAKGLEKHLACLSSLCADSKRKRVPQLCVFNSS